MRTESSPCKYLHEAATIRKSRGCAVARRIFTVLVMMQYDYIMHMSKLIGSFFAIIAYSLFHVTTSSAVHLD